MADIIVHPYPNQLVIPSDDQPHFVATYHKAARLASSYSEDHTVNVYLGSRSGDWLEHRIVVVNKAGESRMVIGAIQRHIDAESEFHS